MKFTHCEYKNLIVIYILNNSYGYTKY